jgi:oligopeptide/dipeptide ABC transporter ATP-binding protein
MRVGSIVEEPLIVHDKSLSRAERTKRVHETFEAVHLDARFADRFPAALSGGQQQRVGIARAVVTRPSFIVLDEPTSSLDLSVRAQILNLLGELQSEFNLAYLFISHDISTVEYFSDRIAVMYRGQIVESGKTEDVMDDPKHPYTAALLSATLSVDPGERQQHFPLEGNIPSNTELPTGCFLAGRCPIEIPECSQARVPLESVSEDRLVRCIRVSPGPLQARLPVAGIAGSDQPDEGSRPEAAGGEPGPTDQSPKEEPE